jgi:cytochrome c oxidase subunit 2
LRNPASGDWGGRLAKLFAIPVLGAILLACTEQANSNPTGDDAAPNLFGQASNGSWGFPHDVVTTEGIASAGLYLPIFLIAVAIFILVEGLLLFLILRYRKRSKGDDLPEQTHGNNLLEVIWTAIPMVIVFVLFVVSTNVLMNDVQAKSDEHGAVVDVQAFRFGWIFDYQDPATLDAEAGTYEPAGITISGGGREGAPEMTLPVGEPVLIRLTAADVIHSWYVPSFFFKRDAIPGRVNEFEITIEQPGVYGGQCAEFCGLAHGDMFFSVNAVSADEYDAWVAERSGAPTGGVDPGADAETEAAGEEEGGSITDPTVMEPESAGGDGPPPADGAEGVQLEIATTADKSIAYTTTSLEAKAGQPVTVTYTNDAEIPHNIAFYDGPDAESTQIVVSETITGPGATTSVSFTAPTEPGEYLFRCELHPLQMVGTLTVTP